MGRVHWDGGGLEDPRGDCVGASEPGTPPKQRLEETAGMKEKHASEVVWRGVQDQGGTRGVGIMSDIKHTGGERGLKHVVVRRVISLFEQQESVAARLLISQGQLAGRLQ